MEAGIMGMIGALHPMVAVVLGMTSKMSKTLREMERRLTELESMLQAKLGGDERS